MLKKILFSIFLFLSFTISNVYSSAPSINCEWLPWCTNWDVNFSNNIWAKLIDSVVSELIQIVAVFAVFALIASWIMYILSWGDEEKSKKSKKWIIWSLVWVFLSISAWWIITYLNSLTIG